MAGLNSSLVDTKCLIAEVLCRPELWDRQHPQHHNRSVLDHHWENVAGALNITGKIARGKWKNLKDHFRKEYKRCLAMDSGQEVSKWPYFQSMMFIKDQITHSASSSVYMTDMHYQNIYPEVEMTEEEQPLNEKLSNSSVKDLSNQTDADVVDVICCRQCENFSDDKHFLLSLLPMFSALSPENKLKARIGFETLLLNIAFPEVSTAKTDQSIQDDNHERNSTKSPTTKVAEKRKRKSAITRKYC